MLSFKKNIILTESDSLAEQLINARLARKLELEKVAQELNINLKYLQALEAGRFDELPAGVYGKNFLREYAQFLNLDSGDLLKLFERETATDKKRSERDLFAKQIVKSRYFLTLPKVIKGLALVLVVVICLAYLSVRLNKIIAPPRLFISTPPDNLITDKFSVAISGSSEPETQIMINGETILSDKAGLFTKEVNLKTGINIITITAQKKYGGKNTVVRQILVKN
jgi:cytoskeletal protein RodZ